MKLSELSYRDYIAIEVLPAIVSRGGKEPYEQVNLTYDIADTMLRKMGQRDPELEELKERAATAERTLEVLRSDAPDQTIPRIALDQIWLQLGVNNQTAAMEKLRELVG